MLFAIISRSRDIEKTIICNGDHILPMLFIWAKWGQIVERIHKIRVPFTKHVKSTCIEYRLSYHNC